jgi:prepilin-type N-terminal cleavage/methylation domain-containing protein
MIHHSKQTGFTIVELLIVVVVIAILAAITIVSFNGIQARANQAKIDSDMSVLNKSILAARNAKGEVPLREITGLTATGGNCWSKPSGTDLAALAKTDLCWTVYLASLDAISTASNINVRNLVDPWGRPYYIDENEAEGTAPSCNKDKIGYYSRPFTTGQTMTTSRFIDTVQRVC